MSSLICLFVSDEDDSATIKYKKTELDHVFLDIEKRIPAAVVKNMAPTKAIEISMDLMRAEREIGTPWGKISSAISLRIKREVSADTIRGLFWRHSSSQFSKQNIQSNQSNSIGIRKITTKNDVKIDDEEIDTKISKHNLMGYDSKKFNNGDRKSEKGINSDQLASNRSDLAERRRRLAEIDRE